MAEKSNAGFIIEELRRQVDHQIAAAAAVDTKAAGLIAATFALAALVVPRIRLETEPQVVAALATFGLVILTIGVMFLAIRPRIAGFSYGPRAEDMLAFMTDDDPPEALERAVAEAFVEVRTLNEEIVKAKAASLRDGMVILALTVVGLGAILAVGGVGVE